jgi:hypothetical protein
MIIKLLPLPVFVLFVWAMLAYLAHGTDLELTAVVLLAVGFAAAVMTSVRAMDAHRGAHRRHGDPGE